VQLLVEAAPTDASAGGRAAVAAAAHEAWASALQFIMYAMRSTAAPCILSDVALDKQIYVEKAARLRCSTSSPSQGSQVRHSGCAA